MEVSQKQHVIVRIMYYFFLFFRANLEVIGDSSRLLVKFYELKLRYNNEFILLAKKSMHEESGS